MTDGVLSDQLWAFWKEMIARARGVYSTLDLRGQDSPTYKLRGLYGINYSTFLAICVM